MSVLIAMAVYSTEENKKDECLAKTLKSLDETVDLKKHKLRLSVNGATDETKKLIRYHSNIIDKVFWNESNLGTAEAINLVWREREPGQHCIKMDDDVVIHQAGWIELMCEAIAREPKLGIVGLKRKDCWERPWETSFEKKSELIYLPQEPGEKCIIVEAANHVMGTCQMYNSDLLDKMGYLFQPCKYGYDDVLASWRSHAGGFKNVFIPYIEIDHIDDGKTPYQIWKENHSKEVQKLVENIAHEYRNGSRSIYYNPFL